MTTPYGSDRPRPPPLGGAPKLNRGDEHFKALNADIERWKNSNPYTILKERNDEYTQYAIGIHFDENNLAPLVLWGLLAGEILFNYRCALDHLVYVLAVVESGQDPPPGHGQLAFPITSSPERFDAALSRIAPLSDAAQAEIERAQPYKGPDPVGHHPLTRLRDLNDIDKHRLLHLAVFSISKTNAEMVGLPPETIAEVWINQDPLEQDAPLLVLTLQEPSQKVEMNLDFSIRIAIWDEDSATVPKKSMMQELSDIRQEVVRLIRVLNPPIDGLRGPVMPRPHRFGDQRPET